MFVFGALNLTNKVFLIHCRVRWTTWLSGSGVLYVCCRALSHLECFCNSQYSSSYLRNEIICFLKMQKTHFVEVICSIVVFDKLTVSNLSHMICLCSHSTCWFSIWHFKFVILGNGRDDSRRNDEVGRHGEDGETICAGLMEMVCLCTKKVAQCCGLFIGAKVHCTARSSWNMKLMQVRIVVTVL